MTFTLHDLIPAAIGVILGAWVLTPKEVAAERTVAIVTLLTAVVLYRWLSGYRVRITKESPK